MENKQKSGNAKATQSQETETVKKMGKCKKGHDLVWFSFSREWRCREFEN